MVTALQLSANLLKPTRRKGRYYPPEFKICAFCSSNSACVITPFATRSLSSLSLSMLAFDIPCSPGIKHQTSPTIQPRPYIGHPITLTNRIGILCLCDFLKAMIVGKKAIGSRTTTIINCQIPMLPMSLPRCSDHQKETLKTL